MSNLFGWSLPPGVSMLLDEEPQYCAACGKSDTEWSEEWNEDTCTWEDASGSMRYYCSPACKDKGPLEFEFSEE